VLRLRFLHPFAIITLLAFLLSMSERVSARKTLRKSAYRPRYITGAHACTRTHTYAHTCAFNRGRGEQPALVLQDAHCLVWLLFFLRRSLAGETEGSGVGKQVLFRYDFSSMPLQNLNRVRLLS
jgi:hypothetical protein